MTTIEFDKVYIESKFEEAEKQLLDANNLYSIHYENFDVTTFDKHNSTLLNAISGKSIVYCLWIGESYNSLHPKYIGHANRTISRQRMRAHLTKKNKATGSQLDKITLYLREKKYFGLTYLIIEPSYMRKSLEDWLINKNSKFLDWNINK